MHYAMYELDQYRNQATPWLRRIFCRLHLLHCHRCRERLTRLGQDDMLIMDLRKSEQKMNIPENPLEYRRLCDIFYDDAAKRRSTV
ncbi:MAG: hypothetical protein HPZ91_08290 [Lentisphaeria bacterium]|nr:hypothetical protein [Lentisphaeria bacterium]